MAIDPFCRRRLVREPRWTLEHNGRSFAFCSDECRAAFLRIIERRQAERRALSGALLSIRGPPKASA
jgi:YHS domain-containing protein